MIGNTVFNPDEPLFLLDESLTPAVAEALKLVGYNFTTVEAAFGHQGVQDPEIIAWCRDNPAVWVHADDRARRRHEALLQTSAVRTLWVYRRRGRMTGKEQLRILAFLLPRLIRAWERSPGQRHYRASAVNSLSTPSLRPVSL